MITMEEISKGIDYSLFDRILHNTNFTKMDALQACRTVFEKTWLVEAMKRYEANAEVEHVTGRIIEKNKKISELEAENEKLKEAILSLGGSLPEGSKGKTEENTIPLPLHQGSTESARSSRLDHMLQGKDDSVGAKAVEEGSRREDGENCASEAPGVGYM